MALLAPAVSEALGPDHLRETLAGEPSAPSRALGRPVRLDMPPQSTMPVFRKDLLRPLTQKSKIIEVQAMCACPSGAFL